MSDPQIPILDLEDLDDSALVEGLGEFGLVYVRGHGLSAAALEALYQDYIGFTHRPVAEKAQLGGADIWYQRGWTPPDTERAVVAGGQPDFKECYFAAPLDVDPECVTEYPEIFAHNVWPTDSDGFQAGQFQARYLDVGRGLHAVGLQLLAGVARALGLPARTFADRVEGASHVTRLLRYLALGPDQVGRVLWGEEHTDFNLLTLLPGGRFYDPAEQPCGKPDDDAGLYLRSRPTPEHPQGRRVQGTAPPDTVTVQVGQQLEILTGGRLLATPHEVRPPKQPGYTRCSLAHFIHLHPHQRVGPLPPFRTEAAIQAYRPSVLAGTYSMKTLVDIGLAPRAQLEKLGYRHYDRLADQRRQEGRA